MYDLDASKKSPMGSNIFFTTAGALMATDISDNFMIRRLTDILSKIGEDSPAAKAIDRLAGECIAQQSIICIMAAMLESHGVINMGEIFDALTEKSKRNGMPPMPDDFFPRIEHNLKWGHIQADVICPATQTAEAKL